jgi:hypothetical protein
VDSLKYFQRDSDTESTYRDDLSNIALKLDSKSRVFKYRYSTSEDRLIPTLEAIGEYIQDKNIDNLLNGYSSGFIKFYNEVYPESKESTFDIDYCLNLTKTAMGSYIGKVEHEKTNDLNQNEIICRCAKVDLHKFTESFLASKGKKVELIRETNMTSFCGGCSSLVKSTFSRLEDDYKFLEGEKLDHWVSKIITMTEEFHVQGNDELDMSATRVDIPNVQIVVNSFDSDKISRADISKNLIHLFDRSLPFKTLIEINFLDN